MVPGSQKTTQALVLVTSEWFKAARRLSRLTREATPARAGREHAQLDYARRRIEAALAEIGLLMVTHDGADYSPQIPAEPVNPEDFDSEERLVVQETLEPTVVLDGRVIARGRVILARAG